MARAACSAIVSLLLRSVLFYPMRQLSFNSGLLPEKYLFCWKSSEEGIFFSIIRADLIIRAARDLLGFRESPFPRKLLSEDLRPRRTAL